MSLREPLHSRPDSTTNDKDHSLKMKSKSEVLTDTLLDSQVFCNVMPYQRSHSSWTAWPLIWRHRRPSEMPVTVYYTRRNNPGVLYLRNKIWTIKFRFVRGVRCPEFFEWSHYACLKSLMLSKVEATSSPDQYFSVIGRLILRKGSAS